MDNIAVGDELIYRVREYASSEHVRIAEIDSIKRPHAMWWSFWMARRKARESMTRVVVCVGIDRC